MFPRSIASRKSFIALLAAVTVTAVTAGIAAGPGPGSPGQTLTEVPLDTSTNWPVIEARVNGRGPYLFIVDTGAAGTVIRDGLARELDLPVVGRSMVRSPASPDGIPVEQVEIDSLAIGTGWSRPARAAALGSASLPIPDEKIVGVLGFPLFHDVLVTFDYPGGTFRIEPGTLPEPDGRTILPMTMSTRGRPLPAVDIRVGPVPVTATIDSGNSRSLTLPADYAGRLPLEAPPEKAPSARLVGAVLEFHRAVLDGAVSIGATAVERPTLDFTDGDGPNLGYEILRHYAVTFDQAAGRVRFLQETPQAAGDRHKLAGLKPQKRYGMRFYGLSSETLEVVEVDPGSPAAAAGLESGDVILALNGTPVAELDPGQRVAALRASPLTLSFRRGGQVRDISMSLDE